jgi:hypothetical protein
MKRFFIASAVVLALFVLTVFVAAAVSGPDQGAVGAAANDATDPNGCALSGVVVLEAQAVPTATKVPCVIDELVGWTDGTQHIERGSSTLTYATTSSEGAQWTIQLRPTCTLPPDATPDPTTAGGVRRHSADRKEDTNAVHEEWFQFDGGCASYVVTIPDRYDEQRVFDELETSFRLIDRSAIDASVRKRSDGAFGLDPS